MKRMIAGAVVIGMMAAAPVFAGSHKDQAFFNVETSVQNDKISTIRFYDKEGHLLYEERVEGRRIDLNSARTRRKLEKLCRELSRRELVRTRLD